MIDFDSYESVSNDFLESKWLNKNCSCLVRTGASNSQTTKLVTKYVGFRVKEQYLLGLEF